MLKGLEYFIILFLFSVYVTVCNKSVIYSTTFVFYLYNCDLFCCMIISIWDKWMSRWLKFENYKKTYRYFAYLKEDCKYCCIYLNARWGFVSEIWHLNMWGCLKNLHMKCWTGLCCTGLLSTAPCRAKPRRASPNCNVRSALFWE
jgi:hypothetical protein